MPSSPGICSCKELPGSFSETKHTIAVKNQDESYTVHLKQKQMQLAGSQL